MMNAVTVSIGTTEDLPERARSVAWIQAAMPIDDVRAFWTQGTSMADAGWTPHQLSTGLWRAYSTHLLRTVRDVLVAWTTVEGSDKVQWYQWDGWTHRFEWTEEARRVPEGLPQAGIALEQIRKARHSGRGPEPKSPPPFGFRPGWTAGPT